MLTLRHYEKRLDRLEIQFQFLRHAVEEMSSAAVKRFFKSKSNQRISNLETKASVLREERIMEEDDLKYMLKLSRKKWTKEFGPKNQYFYKQFTLDDLNRSEFLLLVAHFEWFLKEIHRQLIVADPRRPFARSRNSKSETRPRGEVPVWKVFQPGYENFLSSTFFTKLVDEEVNRVDRLSVEERFKYFEKYFELGFTSLNEKGNEAINALDDLSDLRNNISHEIMNPDAVTHVSAIDLQEARKRYGEVPRKLIAIAKKKYPKQFN